MSETAEVLALLRRRCEAVRAKELERAHGKFAALSSDDRRQVEAITTNIVDALLRPGAARLSADHVAALRHLFALDEAA